MSILALPEELLFIESIEMEGCIFTGREKKITTLCNQLWQGNHSIFSFIFRNRECSGVKDILNDWLSADIQTIIFYIPKNTLQEIRQELVGRISTATINKEIEDFLGSKIYKNLPYIQLYMLNNEIDQEQLSPLFDVENLKKELDRTNSTQAHQFYMVGLPFKFQYKGEIDFYLNNTPIYDKSGTIVSSSKIFTQRIKRGSLLIQSQEGIKIDFFNTYGFTSTDEHLDYELKSLDFTHDSLYFELYKNNPTLLSSKNHEKLLFSAQPYSEEEEKKLIKTVASASSISLPQGAIGINLDSFYIPFTEELEQLHLLLINKNNKNILIGGVYHPQLSCQVIAEIVVDLDHDFIEITNHSNSNLVFEKYDVGLWRLNNKVPEGHLHSDSNIYTDILTDLSSINQLAEQEENEAIITIKPLKTAKLYTEEIEFNDSNLYRDTLGLWIRYSQFELTRFDSSIELNRSLYKMTPEGAILDAFVQYDSEKKRFLHGAKVQKNTQDILSRAISSKSIHLSYAEGELSIENLLDDQYYIVQILSSSQKSIIKSNEKNTCFTTHDFSQLKIDIINKKYHSRPLIRFGLTFQG